MSDEHGVFSPNFASSAQKHSRLVHGCVVAGLVMTLGGGIVLGSALPAFATDDSSATPTSTSAVANTSSTTPTTETWATFPTITTVEAKEFLGVRYVIFPEITRNNPLFIKTKKVTVNGTEIARGSDWSNKKAGTYLKESCLTTGTNTIVITAREEQNGKTRTTEKTITLTVDTASHTATFVKQEDKVTTTGEEAASSAATTPAVTPVDSTEKWETFPTITKVEAENFVGIQWVLFSEIGQYSPFFRKTTTVTVNGTQVELGEDWSNKKKGTYLKESKLKNGQNTIVVTAREEQNGKVKTTEKTIVITVDTTQHTATFVSQNDKVTITTNGTTTPETTNPTTGGNTGTTNGDSSTESSDNSNTPEVVVGEKYNGDVKSLPDGLYTIKYVAERNDRPLEVHAGSMLGDFFDDTAKIERKDGKTYVTFLCHTLGYALLDARFENANGYNAAITVTPDSTNTNRKTFTFEVDDLTTLHRMAVLVTMMGGSEGDIGKVDASNSKYERCRILFNTDEITKGWTDFPALSTGIAELNGSQRLMKALVDLGYDTNKDDNVDASELAAISGTLDLSGKQLTDVTMLAGLSDKVLRLDLHNNQLESLPDHLLDKLTKLQILDISSNKISSLPANFFKNNAQLKTFKANSTKLTSIDANTFAGATGLTTLSLNRNEITYVDVNAFANALALDTLSLSENELTSLAAGTLSKNTQLTFLDLSKNNLLSIPADVASLSNLTKLYLENNGITDVSATAFANTNKLQLLKLSHNNIGTFDGSSLSDKASLDTLYLDDNAITTLGGGENFISKLNTVRVLDLRYNYLSSYYPQLASRKAKDKFFPQKDLTKSTLTKSGDNSVEYTQDLSILDLYLWQTLSNSSRRAEITSLEDFEKQLGDKTAVELLEDQGLHWRIDTVLQKLNADGTYSDVQTVQYPSTTGDEASNGDRSAKQSDKEDKTYAAFTNLAPGTYRVVKRLFIDMFDNFDYPKFELVTNTVAITAPLSPASSGTPNTHQTGTAHNTTQQTTKKSGSTTGSGSIKQASGTTNNSGSKKIPSTADVSAYAASALAGLGALGAGISAFFARRASKKED